MIDSAPRRKIVSQIFIVIFGLASFILASSYNYLLFHTLAEGFSIVVAFSIFILTWKTRQFQENGYLEFLGIAYFFIAILDGVHTFAYKGMSMFPRDDANLATQLWIAARYLESLSFLIAPILLKKQSHFTRLFWGFAVVTALILVVIFMGMFPECFIEGRGLTPFKIASEYLISGLLLTSLILLHRRREYFDARILRLLLVSLLLTIVSELAFTFYVSVYDLSNLIGHLLKILSFYLIYEAIIATGLTQPCELLLHAVKQSEEHFRTLAENLPDVIIRFDRNFRFLYVNPAITRVFGRSAQEYIGKTGEEVNMPPEIITYWQKHLNQVFHRGQPETLEFAFPARDSVRYYQTQLLPEWTSDGSLKTVLSMSYDITDLKRAQEDLRQAKDAAEAANQAKSKFLANMSHEIRTPLNAILGFAEVLAALVTDDQQKIYLQTIQASGRNLLTLINDILDLSKIEAGKMEIHYESVNLARLCLEIRQMFSMNLAQKPLGFYIKVDPEFPDLVLIDEVRVRQILFNLVGNAVKFTEEGEITLSLSCMKTREAVYTITLVVEDSGIGIAPEFQSKLFQAFGQQGHQVTRKYGGTGLGLTITKRLIEMMHGAIHVVSAVGQGSRFTITFYDVAAVGSASCFSQLAQTAAEASPFDPNHIIFEPATILVVDGVEGNRLLIGAFLQECDTIRMLEAENGEQTLNIAEQEQPALILMDLKMPIMDDYATIRQIKCHERLAHIPVIALTASVLTRIKEQVLSSGFDGYLVKPIRRAELFRELIRFLPYTIKKTPTSRVSETGIMQTALSPELLKSHPEIRRDVEQELTPLWKIAQQNAIFDDITRFARQMEIVGERYRIEGFEQFGRKLLHHVQHFDVDQIEIYLTMYSQMISDYE